MIHAATTATTIDQATFTITFHRTFAAPREAVFDAWTQPAQVAQWWDPTGTPLRACAIDLRPGGAFTFASDSGHGPAFAGTYLVVERPTQLVFEALGAVGTVRLELAGPTTQMTVTIRCASAAHLAQFIQVGVDVDTDKTFDNLVALVSAR